ncbi:LysM peptidoglycan-binding domain-containing protein [Streptomyces piniterrae]|uniref:LysM peptidoglycan-binding domain-containing protein n=1 Tax=Streptomyces piniterrae TaxID=2571125 RepID=A0A4U0N8R5_9ACTN|nr:transglycosylase family protein [Streptomyces piniterrae]TJZ50170.1 LysM peptidoglycan-binding domain-containing protein [Streptomyces piniterrae]
MSSRHAKRSVEAILSMALVLLPVVGPSGRSAAATTGSPPPGGTNWAKIAACESSGRWHVNTGNGFYGGLQIHPSTWRAYGGHRYAARPDLATRAQQIAVGERIVRDRGLSPWPHCGHLGAPGSDGEGSDSDGDGGNGDEDSDEDTAAGTSRRTSSAPGSRQRSHRAPGTHHRYVVRTGDCLSVIAEHAGQRGGTRALYELNKHTLDEGPDRVYRGQRLRLHR